MSYSECYVNRGLFLQGSRFQIEPISLKLLKLKAIYLQNVLPE